MLTKTVLAVSEHSKYLKPEVWSFSVLAGYERLTAVTTLIHTVTTTPGQVKSPVLQKTSVVSLFPCLFLCIHQQCLPRDWTVRFLEQTPHIVFAQGKDQRWRGVR